MTTRHTSRRRILQTATALTGFAAFGRAAAGQTAAPSLAPAGLEPQLAQIQLARIPSLLAQNGAPPALISALTNIGDASLRGGGLGHGGKARRTSNPALLKSPGNAHFVPQGQPFRDDERLAYAPRVAHGRGLP